MERSENAALDSSTPSEPQFDCLANSLVQLLETAKQDLERDRQAPRRHRWQKRHPFYNQRSTVVRALTALERVDWQAGR